MTAMGLIRVDIAHAGPVIILTPLGKLDAASHVLLWQAVDRAARTDARELIFSCNTLAALPENFAALLQQIEDRVTDKGMSFHLADIPKSMRREFKQTADAPVNLMKTSKGLLKKEKLNSVDLVALQPVERPEPAPQEQPPAPGTAVPPRTRADAAPSPSVPAPMNAKPARPAKPPLSPVQLRRRSIHRGVAIILAFFVGGLAATLVWLGTQMYLNRTDHLLTLGGDHHLVFMEKLQRAMRRKGLTFRKRERQRIAALRRRLLDTTDRLARTLPSQETAELKSVTLRDLRHELADIAEVIERPKEYAKIDGLLALTEVQQQYLDSLDIVKQVTGAAPAAVARPAPRRLPPTRAPEKTTAKEEKTQAESEDYQKHWTDELFDEYDNLKLRTLLVRHYPDKRDHYIDRDDYRSGFVYIDLYDSHGPGHGEDGDTITVTLNGQVLANNHILVGHKVVVGMLNPGNNRLVIQATGSGGHGHCSLGVRIFGQVKVDGAPAPKSIEAWAPVGTAYTCNITAM